MAVQSGFFEAEWDPELWNEETHDYGDWDRKYFADQFARYFSKFVSTGVMNDVPNQLKVSAGTGMNVTVSPGFAYINGFWCYNDMPLSLTVPLNESPSSRYDSVRVRWNATTRRIEILYIADDIVNVRNENYYDLQLAQIKVDPSVSSISSSDITDVRFNDTLCGLIVLPKAEDIGNIANLQTTDKTNLVNAINSLVGTEDEFIVSHREFTFDSTTRTYTYTDERITAESLADVYFDSASFNNAQQANITVETYAGYLTLVAARIPAGTISGTIKVRVV